MPDAFDPYYEWLGIPPREQPVNYYRLLALNLYESNSQVIANAADRQMTYIRMFQNGAHAKESQTILNEIAKARVTLLNETNKREYDDNLKHQTFRGELRSAAPPVPDVPPVSPFNNFTQVPDAPHVSPVNDFAPVLPEDAGFSNSTAHNFGAISDVERLRLEAEIQRIEAEEKAQRKRILTAVAVGSCFLVFLTILVLVNKFSCLSLTSVREGELAATRETTSQTIKEPSDVVELPTSAETPEASAREEELAATRKTTSQTIDESSDSVELPTSAETPEAPTVREEELAATRETTSQTIKEPSDAVELPTSAGTRIVKTVNDVEFAFRWCPAGTFIMGSPKTEEGREPSWSGKETQHRVTLTEGFWMQETEVTQAQWKAVMENNLSSFKGDDLPVENVSWDDCQKFCRKCKDLGLPVQLPTEAQWEYACRAGSTTRFSFGNSDDFLFQYCNYCDKSNTSGFNYQDKDHDDGYDKTAPVKSLRPNVWGLYDMHGNVWEWCNDSHRHDLTSNSVTDPKGPERGPCHVFRGGSWHVYFQECRSAIRGPIPSDYRFCDIGFRTVLASFVMIDRSQKKQQGNELLTRKKEEAESGKAGLEENIVEVMSSKAESESAKAKPESRPMVPVSSNRRAGDRLVKTVRRVEFAFRWCPAGTFMMGSSTSEEGRDRNERQHRVTLTKGFWMQETEVTQAQWKAVMGRNPSQFEGDDLPVENVMWADCQDFCEKCKDLGLPVQLPTEAQWEYACRAGSTTKYFWGSSLNGYNANCNGSRPCGTTIEGPYLEKTVPVRSYQPNAWGLYDMHGNVSEWCNDWYNDRMTSFPVTDPKGPENGAFRVLRVHRGGDWNSRAQYSRSASRRWLDPRKRSHDVGFRLSIGE